MTATVINDDSIFSDDKVTVRYDPLIGKVTLEVDAHSGVLHFDPETSKQLRKALKAAERWAGVKS